MSTKVCLRFHRWCFFRQKRAFELIYWKPRRTKTLISRVWNKILKIWDILFELINAEVQSNKNYCNAQNWKICILYIYWECLLCLQSNASGSFLQTCITFVEQRLKFTHFEGSIIPYLDLTLSGKLRGVDWVKVKVRLFK